MSQPVEPSFCQPIDMPTTPSFLAPELYYSQQNQSGDSGNSSLEETVPNPMLASASTSQERAPSQERLLPSAPLRQNEVSLETLDVQKATQACLVGPDNPPSRDLGSVERIQGGKKYPSVGGNSSQQRDISTSFPVNCKGCPKIDMAASFPESEKHIICNNNISNSNPSLVKPFRSSGNDGLNGANPDFLDIYQASFGIPRHSAVENFKTGGFAPWGSNGQNNERHDRGFVRDPGLPSTSTKEDDNLNNTDDGGFIIDLDDFERELAQQKLSLLEEMFPNAETVFLQAKCAELALDNLSFQAFVDQTMMSGDYPKKIIANVPEIEQNSKSSFTQPTKFDLQTFLTKYPDPVKHFSLNVNAIHCIQHACNYLLMRYPFVAAMVVRNRLVKNNYNVYLADLELRKMPKTRKGARKANELKAAPGAPPEEFFDVINFIENENVINQYLSDRLIARANAVEEARLANALLECGCCFADDLLAEDVSNCTEGHIFCKDCILKSVQVGMGDGKVDFPCLQECSGVFEVLMLKEILPVGVFEKLERKLAERDVAAANISGLETCPFCEYCAVPPEEDRLFYCENCKKESCRLCRRQSHVPLRCSEVEATLGRVFVEEKMTDALLRTCWKCQKKFIREDGCNKMTCVCGAVMCYICRAPIKGYDHFDREARGSSATPSNRCPLWTNNRALHRHEVRAERERAINDLKRTNPNLDVDSMFKKKRSSH